MTMQGRLEWFKELKRAQSHASVGDYTLLAELDLGKSHYETIKAATSRYILACVEHPLDIESDNDLMNFLESQVDNIANRTPNGAIMPKLELEDEFHQLHESVSNYIQSLGVDDTINSLQCPIIVRMVKGTRDDSDNRRYASTKIHMDPWNGDPWDEVIVSIPVLGDIERTGMDFFEPPKELDSRLLHTFASYEEAQQEWGNFDPNPLRQRVGYAYFMDAVIPHRTVKQGGLIRVTVEFRLRRQISEEERSFIEGAGDADRLNAFLDRTEWHSLGTTKRMRFLDTYADAKQGVFVDRPYNELVYSLEAN